MRAPLARGRVAAELRRSAPALAAWLAAAAVLAATCLAEGFDPLSPLATWTRWDGALYLSVARGGYDAYQCEPAINARLWCGDAGWFPAYPWAVRGLHSLGLPLADGALALAWLAWLGTLVVLWRALLPRGGPAALPALLYAAFAPSLVYDYALFPLSLLSFATVCCFALVLRGRDVAASLAAAVATLAYPLGLLVAAASALWALGERGSPLRARLARAGLLALPSLAALGLFAADQWGETGHWDAYLLVQRKYGHRLTDPFAAVSAAAGTLLHGSAVQLAPGLAVRTIAPALQTLLVFCVLAAVLAELVARRAAATRAELLVALWAVALWIAAHAETNVSSYRGEAALAPVAILVARLPRPLALTATACALGLVVPMARLFLRTELF